MFPTVFFASDLEYSYLCFQNRISNCIVAFSEVSDMVSGIDGMLTMGFQDRW